MIRRMLPLAALLLAGTLVWSGCGDTTMVSTPEVVAAAESEGGDLTPGPAPDFDLPNAEGGQVKLSSYKGQVVLLNFWATWCGPCKIEMPWFIEFQRKYKDQGFSVLAVSLDEEGWDVVRPYVDELKPNFPILLGDDDLAEKFGDIMALPTTLIIDKQGRIVNRHTGLISKSDYEDEIEKLL